jgi:hypothetical protein
MKYTVRDSKHSHPKVDIVDGWMKYTVRDSKHTHPKRIGVPWRRPGLVQNKGHVISHPEPVLARFLGGEGGAGSGACKGEM